MTSSSCDSRQSRPGGLPDHRGDLSPELLPAILGVNLARGAQVLAQCGVLVRHLNAIENHRPVCPRDGAAEAVVLSSSRSSLRRVNACGALPQVESLKLLTAAADYAALRLARIAARDYWIGQIHRPS